MKLEPPSVLDISVTLLPHHPIPGVYFLCLDDTVVYIGASKDVVRSVHAPEIDRGCWDRAYYVPSHKAEELKAALVRKYLPRFNPIPKDMMNHHALVSL